MKKIAVPSQNLPTKSCLRPKAKCRTQRCLSTVKSIERVTPEVEFLRETNPSGGTNLHPLSKAEQAAVDSLLELVDVRVNSTGKEEKATQVKSGDIITPFIACIDTDAKLCSLAGLHSLKLLDVLVKLVCEYFPDIRQNRLTMKERIFMTFIKMKTGLRYVVLASLFGTVTSKTCKIIVHDTISKLAFVLKPLIVWPTSEECRRNLPKCFEKFPNVRVVLDCTEISIQKPKSLCCQIITYSHYKGTQTVKFMTGVSPAGLITFVSDAYGGRASDNAIFEQSGIIKKLEMGRDAIMVDKGFRIENITDAHYIKLYRPPFLKNKGQFSEEEALENVEIAKARVHIERSNQRIKVFEIFSKPLPITLLPKINDIFIIACAIVNISKPILSDEKFL